MALKAETIYIEVDAKTSKALKGLKDTDKQSNTLFKTFKNLAGPVALGAVAVATIRMGKEFSRAASNANEIRSKYATIFRDMSGEAESMADSFADSFGLAGSTARELLGNTGDLLTGLGFTQKGALDLSKQVNSLAADLASFSNFSGGTAGASEALTKALLGEAESAKSLGIVINQNSKEYKDSVKYYTQVEGKTLLQAKAYTALKMATEQSGNAIGDVQRTYNSTANVQRRLEQSTLALKEALGESINEGMTPMLVVTDDIVSSLAKWIAKNTKINNFFRDWKQGSIDTKVEMDTLNDALRLAEARLVQATNAGHGHTQALQAEVDKLKIAIAARARASAFDAQFADEKAAQDQAAEDAATKAKDREKERLSDLKNLNEAFASTKEGQIQATQSLIDYYNTFLQTPKVKAVLEDLYATMDGLTKETVDNQKISFEGMANIAEEWRQKELTAIFATADAEKQALQEREDAYVSLGNTIAGFTSGTMEALGEAIVKGGDAWKELQKAAVISIANIVKSLGDQAVVQAAIALATGDFVHAGLYTAAATGAYVTSGAIKASADTFATGGSFTTTGATPIVVGDNASGQERVDITPVGGSGGDNQTMILNIDGASFTGWLQNTIDNGGVRIPRRILI